MAKKLAEIELQINNSNYLFAEYLQKSFSKSVLNLLDILTNVTKAYIFSGIIRNYFLNIPENRDLDLVIDYEFEIEPLLIGFTYRRNSYGGYKISIGETNIDLWLLKDTWSLKNTQLILDFELEKYIPQTAFFNFSAVIYSLNEKKFHYTKHFLRFLRDKGN